MGHHDTSIVAYEEIKKTGNTAIEKTCGCSKYLWPRRNAAPTSSSFRLMFISQLFVFKYRDHVSWLFITLSSRMLPLPTKHYLSHFKIRYRSIFWATLSRYPPTSGSPPTSVANSRFHFSPPEGKPLKELRARVVMRQKMGSEGNLAEVWRRDGAKNVWHASMNWAVRKGHGV